MNKDEIMKQFDEAIKNLKEWVEDKPKEKIVNQDWTRDPNRSWEDRLGGMTGHPTEVHFIEIKRDGCVGTAVMTFDSLKDFIRQEFKAMGEEIINACYCQIMAVTCVEAVNEALRKRGVK